MKSFKVLTALLTIATGLNSVAKEISFSRACERGQNITISAVGDILLHETLQRRAVKENSFSVLWENVVPYFESSDFSYGNLESPSASGINKKGEEVRDPGFVYDGEVYSSYPRFNYHPSIIHELKKSGIDIISTANNHTLDRLSVGVDETLKAIEKEDMLLIGSRYKKDQKKDRLSDWYRVTDIKGIKVAWISCTFLMNYPMKDEFDQVMYCHTSKGVSRINQIIKEQKDKVDAIFITPHWGDEYQSEPNEKQKTFARNWIEQGATAIIGSHPHVLQPMEVIKTKDGREGFVIYSLGNFVSNQGGKESECNGKRECLDKKIAQRSTVTLFLGLTKNNSGTFLNGVKALPMRMVRQYDTDNINLELISREVEFFNERIALSEELNLPDTNGLGRRELNHIKSVIANKNIVYDGDIVNTRDQCQ